MEDSSKKINQMSSKAKWLTRTGILLAMLVVLQAVTKPGGQFLTGSCVNLILAVAVLYGGFFCGLAVAVVSPFFAFLLGIGPAFIQLTPAIAAGNAVFIALLFAFSLGKRGTSILWRYGAVVVAAAAKALSLWLLVAKLIVPMLELPAKQAQAISATFSAPQLVTALIGGCIAATMAPILVKAQKK